MLKRKSKESNNSFLSSRPSKKNALSRVSQPSSRPNGVFQQVMTKAGYVIGYDDTSNELEVDQAVFQRNLGRLLKTHENFPEVIGEFVDGIQKYLEDNKRLELSLMPTATSVSCKSARDVCQDSLIHLLLGIEILQEKVSYFLLEKVMEISILEKDTIFNRKHGKSLPCMILSQFRWLNKLVNSEALSDQMLDLIKATPHEVQGDVISLLPDIISDCDHPKVACSLSEILLSYQDLSAVILESLSNLNIKAETMSQVRKQVLKTLSSVNIQDLHIVVKFSLQNLGPDEACETINEIRKQLDFTSCFDPVTTSTPCYSSSRISSEKGLAVLTMDAIKLALKFQKSLCDSWIKVIETEKTPGQHKSLDFVVLLIIHSLGACKRNVETLLRSKLKGGEFNEDLLQVTFRFYTEILKEYLPTLMALADILLRSFEPVVSSYGGLMYQKSFISFDSFNKQEVIGNLVTHVGNGSEHEVNAALDTLVTLVEQHSEKMAPFGCFLKNIMDHLDSLTLGQIRKVYCMLSILAYRGGHEGAMLKDDIFIIIRKQLTNSSSRYQKMGVMGALMAAKAASIRQDEHDSTSSSCLQGSQSSKEEGQQQAISLIELVMKSTANYPEAMALFCDELFRIIHRRQVDKAVEEWISQKVLNDFQEFYIMDVNPEMVQQFDDGIEAKFGIDEIIDESICINLNKLLEMEHGKTVAVNKKCASEMPKSPLTLSPYFRLLRICEMCQHGSSLQSIDSLLGCCVVIPALQENKFANLSTKEKHLILNVMFYLINLFRELLNAFAPVDDAEIRIKVCQRLRHVVQLQERVKEFLQDAPNYTPPQAIFDSENVENEHFKFAVPAKPAPKKAKTGTKKKTKKTKNGKDTSIQDTQSIIDEPEHDRSVSGENSSDKNLDAKVPASLTSSSNILQPYLREIDIEVFILLQLKMNLKTSIDTVGSSEELLLLSPLEMKFLLEDFVHKLQHCLVSTSSLAKMRLHPKPIGFSNLEISSPAEVSAFTINILPCLCQMLEDCSGYFQHVISECDGVLDSVNILSDEAQIVSSCMQLVFQSLSCLFAWKGLSTAQYSPLLKESMRGLASRMNKLPDHTSTQDLIKHSIKYLSKFQDTVISLFGATALVKLIDTISRFSKHSSQKRMVYIIAEDFLQRDWPEISNKKLKPSKINDLIHLLLDAYLGHSDSAMEPLEHLSTVAIPQLVNGENSTEEPSFKTLTKGTFNCYYKLMLNYLVGSMKTYYSSGPSDVNEELVQWTVAIKIFHILVDLTKVFDGKSNLNSCLKNSRHFVDIFLRHGMPMLDKLFLTHQEDSHNLLKNLQASTRYLQNICSHTKVLKDVSLTNSVPFLKKTLESLVYRVKGMLAVNSCSEAFWLGNLKNKNLKGEEILSQKVNTTEHEGSASEEDSDEIRSPSKSSENDGSDSSEEM